MSAQTAQVTAMRTKSFYETVTNFLNAEYENEKTRTEYKRDIESFFRFFYNKSLAELTRKDIEEFEKDENSTYIPISYEHVNQYKTHLMNLHPNANSSVMRKIYSVKALYLYLKKIRYKVDPEAFKIKTLKSNPDSYDILNPDQVVAMAELAEQERNGDELSAWVYLAAITSIRLSAALSITWDRVRYDDASGLYIITAHEKRDEIVQRPIEQWLYNRLEAIRQKYKSELLFPNLKMDKVNKSVQRIAYDKMGVPTFKRITPHSLRKTAIDYEMKTTGNIKRAMMQSGHKVAQTLIDHYTDKNVDYTSLAGIRMLKQVNDSALKEMSVEDVLELLKGTNKEVYNQLAIKAEQRKG